MSDPLAGLAPKAAVPHFKSATPLSQLKLGPEEGFVLSRVDGSTRLGELLNLVPFPPEQTVAILRRLWISGAIEIAGHAPPVMTSAPVAKPTSTSSSQVIAVVSSLPPEIQLTLEQAQHIDRVYSQIGTLNAFQILGIERGCDKKDIKRAYFKLSKEFHPDRFYGRNLGGYAERLSQIFQSLKSAFDLLSDDNRRAAYEDSLQR